MSTTLSNEHRIAWHGMAWHGIIAHKMSAGCRQTSYYYITCGL